MNKHLESIYKNSPICFQDIFCSLYGFKLYRERYGPAWRLYFNHLIKTQFANEEEINLMQVISLKKILRHAIKHVPYYRDTIKLKNEVIERISSMENIREIPVLDKSTLRNNPEEFLSNYYSKNKLVKVHTSGTTGTPLTIYIDPNARKRNYAFFERSKRWVGINGFEKSITFAGRTIVPVGQTEPPFWRKNRIFNNTLFSSYHLSENNIKHYVNKIRVIKPVFIDSYPSSIAFIADYLLKNGINDIKTKAIITSAETLFDHQREKIEMAFSSKVYDQYGSAEQVVFACQCKEGCYHVNPEYGYLEVLDKNDEPVKSGELGDFVVTGFTNDAMPLIRYKIGDKGVLGSIKCKCGSSFPVIERIYGRVDDILITPDGKYVGRLDPVFKDLKDSINETQIIQERLDLVTILIVKAENYNESHGNSIIDELKKRMGNSIMFNIKYVTTIPRTKSGKFRAVICKVK